MSKYKFVVYEKLDGDAHTSRMLEQGYHGNIPEEITDKQLESSRVNTDKSTIEKLLEKTRTGSSEVILEKNLNDSKNEFGSKHRNPEAYEGSISKLEEKRLAQYNIEDEKYESASEIPKRQRWWEVKSEDGLKVAFKKKANIDDDYDIDWDYLENGDNEFDDEFDDEFPIDRVEDDFPVDEMDIDFQDDSIDEIEEINMKDKYYEEIDVGGTPTAFGKIKITGIDYIDDPSDLEDDLRDFMLIHHDNVPFSMNSFDFSNLKDGIISYQIGITNNENAFEIDDLEASSKFPIVEATKKK